MTNNNSANNKRIAKNTMMLYIRMFLTLGVSLYTARVVLNVLGVDDFGIYNIVGGLVIFFSFIQNALTTATQRFLNYEIGLNNTEGVKKIFNTSINVYFITSLIVILFAETLGLWYVNNKLNIPIERKEVTLWVYQMSVVTTVVQIMRMPYNASIIAFEKMSFYAYISIIEVFLNLIVVFILFYNHLFDNLKLYSVLILILNVFISFIYKIYCNRKIEATHFMFFFDKKSFLNLLNFSGWSLFGSLSVVGGNQGIALILNFFYGVAVNASLGIANQVGNSVNRFVTSFQVAFSPQIVKSYASNDYGYLNKLILRTSKYSFFLMLLICLPFFLEAKYIIILWLGEVPAYIESFVRLTLLYFLIESLAGPYYSVIYASGKIRYYQIFLSLFMCLNISLVFVALKLGLSPTYALLIKLIISFILVILRVFIVKKFIKASLSIFFKEVMMPILLISCCSIILPLIIYLYLDYSFIRLILVVFLSLTSTLVSIYLLGLNKEEKQMVDDKILKILKRYN